MAPTNIVASFIEHCPLVVLLFQVEYYSQRIEQVEDKQSPESVFLKTTLCELKKSLPKFLN